MFFLVKPASNALSLLLGNQGQYKKTFIQSYLNHTTKTDQFASFKDFEDKVIHLSDANDRGVLTGEKTVKMLQNKLSKVFTEVLTVPWMHESVSCTDLEKFKDA